VAQCAGQGAAEIGDPQTFHPVIGAQPQRDDRVFRVGIFRKPGERLVVRLTGRRSFVVDAPASTPASPKDLGPLCRQITDFVWQERRLLVSWSVIPEASVDAHSDVGLVGVVTANGLP